MGQITRTEYQWLATHLSQAPGLTPGTEDPHVARWIAQDVIADSRSALTLDGQGVRFVGQEGLESERQETIPAIPLPASLWLLAGGIGLLAMMIRKTK